MTNFLRFQALNIKRLKRVDIDLTGINVLKIGGRNAQGKSSLCDAMVYLLSGKASQCKEPVHGDAKEGIVIGELDNGFILTRKIKPDGKSELVIEEKGEKGITKTLKRPAEIVERLTGKAWIDFDAVLKMGECEISETIRKVAGIDFTDLDEKRAVIYKHRTGINGEVKSLKARFNSSPTFCDTINETVNTAEKLHEVERAYKHNRELQDVSNTLLKISAGIKSKRDEIAKIENDIAEAKRSHAMWTESIQGKELIDTAAIRAEIASAEETNAKVRANLEAVKIAEEMSKAEAQANTLTNQIAEIDAEKERVLSTAEFPIPSMSYRDGMVTYNGRPLSQASSSEWVEIVAATAFRSNPELKVL